MRIHVVDDNPDNVRILRFLLEDHGAEVSESTDGAQAVYRVLGAVEQGRPHEAILMDMSMPVLDGYEATRRLRDAGIKTPIIALTAYSMAGDREKCLSAGCDAYLTKPIQPDSLLRTLAKVTQSAVETTVESSAEPQETRSRTFDQELVIVSSMADDPRFSTLLEDYLKGLRGVVKQMDQIQAERDLDALRKLTHQIKGTGASYGFPQLTEVAGCCEDEIRRGGSWADAAPFAAKLTGLLRRCLPR